MHAQSPDFILICLTCRKTATAANTPMIMKYIEYLLTLDITSASLGEENACNNKMVFYSTGWTSFISYHILSIILEKDINFSHIIILLKSQIYSWIQSDPRKVNFENMQKLSSKQFPRIISANNRFFVLMHIETKFSMVKNIPISFF